MSKRIIFTESQAKEIAKKINEMQVYQQGNGNQTTAQVVNACKSSNPSLTDKDSVTIPADTVTDGKTVNGGAEGTTISAPITSESCITKRQIKEMKLKKLKESCIKYKKSDIQKMF